MTRKIRYKDNFNLSLLVNSDSKNTMSYTVDDGKKKREKKKLI